MSTGTILKARFGDDIRKSSLHHNNDLTFIDLLLNVQRIFALPGDSHVVLKYKDQDGDLVTLSNDSDVLLALHTVGATLDVTVSVATHNFELASNVQKQVEQIKLDVQKLLVSVSMLSAIDNVSSLAETTAALDINQTYQAPPSPVPSEKPELPATIQPSVQEQYEHFNHRPAQVEEEIPLENHLPPSSNPPEATDTLNTSFTQPPIENFAAIPPPNATIPSFPTSNAALPPPVHQEHPQFGGAPPASVPQHFQPPPLSGASQSSVSSTPVPQSPPQPPQQQPFAPPPPTQPPFGGAPPSGPPSEFGGYAPPPPNPAGPQGFAPPQFGGPPPPQGPPQGFQAPPQQFGAPPQVGGPGGPPPPPQGFAPPQQQQQGFAPPPPPSAGGPGSFGPPPPSGPGQFGAPPQGFGAPPQGVPGGPVGQFGAPPQQGFGAPPPPQAPGQFGPPPTGFPPVGGPPGGPQGANPFARGPTGYRQSPYHQQ